MMRAYREHQRFAIWVYAFVIAIACISIGAMRWEARSADKNPALFAVVLFLFLFDILVLRTEIDHGMLRVRLGHPIPIFWKQFDIGSIRETRVVTYRPLLDAGGWGLRFGRLEGRFTTFWNARGNRGVMIETETRRYVIGSQAPEALHRAIEDARRRPT